MSKIKEILKNFSNAMSDYNMRYSNNKEECF